MRLAKGALHRARQQAERPGRQGHENENTKSTVVSVVWRRCARRTS